MSSSFSFYIKHYMNTESLDELDDMKQALNRTLSQLRVEVDEKAAAANTCKLRYLTQAGYAPHSCRLFNGEYIMSDGNFCMTETQRDHAVRALANLEIEEKLCDSFYNFVRLCHATSNGETDIAKEVIRDAIRYSSTLKTSAATLEFWGVSQ